MSAINQTTPVTEFGETQASPPKAAWHLRWVDGLVATFESHPMRVICGFFLFHTTLRCLLPFSVGFDEGEQLLVTQTWAWGYSGQPPLYNWLQKVAFAIFGVNATAMIVVKQSLLALIFLTVYQLWRAAGLEVRLASAAAFSLFLLTEVGWELQRTRTHLVGALLFVSLFSWFAVALFQNGDKGNRGRYYFGLGIAAGFGMLAKYNFFLFPIALAVSAASFNETRKFVLTPWIAVSVIVAGLVFAPHLVWYPQTGHQFGSTFTESRGDELVAGWATTWLAFQAFATSLFQFFLMPLILGTILMLDWREWQFSHQHIFDRLDPSTQRIIKLIGLACILALAFMLLIVIGTGLTNVRGRWFVPVSFLAVAPALLSTRILHGPNVRRIYWLAILAIMLTSTVAITKTSLDGYKGKGDFADLPVLEGPEWELAKSNPDSTLFLIDDQRVAAQLRFQFPEFSVVAFDYSIADQTNLKQRFALVQLREGELSQEFESLLSTHFSEFQVGTFRRLGRIGPPKREHREWVIAKLDKRAVKD